MSTLPDKSRRTCPAVALLLPIVVLGALVAPAIGSPASAATKNVTVQEPDRAFLGIRMRPGNGIGIQVDGVIPGSAAERAGIQAGDVIVGIGPHAVRYPNQLKDRLADMQPGDLADVAVLRGGGEQRLDVELGGRAGRIKIDLDGTFTMVSPRKRGDVEGTIHVNSVGDLHKIFLCQEDNCRFSGNDRIWYRADCIGRGCPTFQVQYYDRPMLGVQLADRKALLEKYPDGDVAGLLIAEVFAGSPADEAGIQAGDVIVSVDGQAVASARDLQQLLKKLDAAGGGAMEPDIVRDGGDLRLRVYMPGRSPAKR